MNNFKRRLIALAALMCVALTSVTGCSKAKDDSKSESGKSGSSQGQEADEAPLVVAPFTWSANEEGDDPLDTPDPEAPEGDKTEDPTASSEKTTEVEAVTDASGQPVTEFVTATDAQGQPVTNAQGQPVTEAVQVTTIVESAAQATTKAYTAATTGMYAMWIDISKDDNFYFNDSFVKVGERVAGIGET
ncbi:MAG: hypothetical protein IKQ90_01125 [Ruminococcus sp.]|nr:hypothetical protein [Ruminococcus sp.]